MINRIFILSLLFLSSHAFSQTSSLWLDISSKSLNSIPSELSLLPDKYRLLSLDEQAMRDKLALTDNSSAQSNSAGRRSIQIDLPLPTGESISLIVEPTTVMAPELAAKYPQFKTYRVDARNNNGISGVVDMNSKGFHAMLIMLDGSRLFIDPRQSSNSRFYISYYDKQYHPSDKEPFSCVVEENNHLKQSSSTVNNVAQRTGENLKTFRLAMAATGEYTVFHGGTVNLGLAAIVTTVSRVNVIYERDLAIKLELIANNDVLVFTDPSTDGYSNFSGFTMLSENQTKIDTVIGSGNYDIGHVLSTGGGGIAGLGVVCSTGKARGVTGLNAPIGDPFDVDYVAHEVGHQFNAEHTFNSQTNSCGGSNRSAAFAFEPGSGSTISAYAGICGSTNNLQTNSDAMFHLKSIEAISSFVDSGFGSFCGTSSSLNNQQPTVNAGSDFTIPINTPFELTATGNDADADPLTYSWEQIDAGAASDVDVDSVNNAIFRAFLPQSSATRVFPKLSAILSNTSSKGEKLPVTDRSINFSVAVRDGVGGLNTDNMVVTATTSSNNFQITSHGSSASFNAGANTTVTWNVVNTNNAPVNCSNVDIFLTTDGGSTFTNVSGGTTANDGSQTVTIPANVVDSTTARFKVKCNGNIFFDVSNADLTTVAGGGGGTDTDGDGVPDASDNCPDDPNPSQLDNEGDGLGDVCDIDDDNDSIPDTFEIQHGLNPFDFSDASLDGDNDGLTNLQEFSTGRNPNINEAAISIQPLFMLLKDK